MLFYGNKTHICIFRLSIIFMVLKGILLMDLRVFRSHIFLLLSLLFLSKHKESNVTFFYKANYLNLLLKTFYKNLFLINY